VKEYSIALVVDRAFGERLVELASRLHEEQAEELAPRISP
jgi:hypothetical protein